MIRTLPYVFARAFNTPLAIHHARLEPLIAGLLAARDARGSAISAEAQTWHRTGGGYSVSSGGIARLVIRDVLVKRDGEVQPDSTELMSYESISRRLDAAVANPDVRGIMLDISSGGGEVGGLFDLVRDITAKRAFKPIWAVANDDAFSAAYAIASAAERVYVTEAGGVGSVGVIAMHANQEGHDAKEGFAYEAIFAGARKADFSPHAALSPEARAGLQAEVDRLHGIFIDLVAGNRGISADTVRSTEAGVFYGPEAVTMGLADEVGTFNQAADAMAETLGASAAKPATVALVSDQPAVVSLDSFRAATGRVRSDAVEIVGLCAVAGFPDLAAGFISGETPLAAVRAELTRQKAEADAARVIVPVDTTHRPPAAASELAQVAAARFASHQTGRKGA